MALVIAIDGPGGAGKGTVAKKLADELGLCYLDTGKIYRAVGLKMLQARFVTDNASDDAFKAAAVTMAKEMSVDKFLDMQESGQLTNPEVANMASHVSSIPALRSELLEFQRRVAKADSGAVLDGRDIGTVVCPEAGFKFFITASVEERAKRRYKELKYTNDRVIYDDVLRDLTLRDERDAGRDVAPMRPADDAIVVDTTELSIEQVFTKLINAVRN